jgi:tetratricopeptide (TPR) repeat protein
MNPLPESDLAKPFDVFLCHNSKDKPMIRAIALQLKQRGISYWLDEEQLLPGYHWREIQERDMPYLKTVAVFMGKNGIGEWQDMEISIFLQKHRECRLPIIPVFLDDAPEKANLPEFLKPFTWINFRCPDPDPIKQLVTGITQSQSNADSVSIPLTEEIIEAAIQANIPNNLTQQGAIDFVGRSAELDRLHDLVQQETPVAICTIAGMGGVGKTELALQYAYQQRNRQTYPGSICWLQARQDLKIQLVLFAQTHLELHPPTDWDLDAQLHWCWQRWGEGKTLLILDDVQAYTNVESLAIPGRSQFKVLMTTRSQFGALVRELNLEVLSEAAALELLRSFVTDGRIDRQLAEAKEICEWLGYLPLGLELVGRYLALDEDLSVAEMLAELHQNALTVDALLTAEPGMTAQLGVVAAFELSWRNLSAEAQQVAAMLSLFALAEFSWSWVEACLPEIGAKTLRQIRVRELLGFHLLQRRAEGQYQLHQLLRKFFAAKRQQMASSETWHETFFDVIRAEAQRSSERPTRSLLEETTAVIPHLQSAIEQAENTQQQLNVAFGKNQLARLYELQGHYSEAEPLYLQALEIYQSQLGYDHPDTASSLNNLAALYELQGRYSEAEPLYLQALDIRRSQLGHDHPDTATSLNNSAGLYRSQGRYSEAESLYLQALEIRRSQLGHDHPDTATILNNLAGLYRLQGRYSEAESLQLQALEIRRSKLGRDHPDTATSLNNLAGLYELQGHYSEAESLYLKALEIRRSQLGHDHPFTATILNSLAGLYRSQGRYNQAELLYLQALEIRRSQLGHDHPATARSLNNLALLYNSQRRYGEAEPLCLQALKICQSQLGHDHPDTATSLNHLAELYNSQGRYSEAEPWYVQALEILFSRLGEGHPTTITVLNNFNTCLQQALEAGQSDRLSDHPLTQSILQQLRTP